VELYEWTAGHCVVERSGTSLEVRVAEQQASILACCPERSMGSSDGVGLLFTN
jgi:hypothetical protein